MTLTVGWWVVPAIIAAAVFVWALRGCADLRGNAYGANGIIALIYYGTAAIIALCAWLFWALLLGPH